MGHNIYDKWLTEDLIELRLTNNKILLKFIFKNIEN